MKTIFLYSQETKQGCCVSGNCKGTSLTSFKTSRKNFNRTNYFIDMEHADTNLKSELIALKGHYILHTNILGSILHGRLALAIRNCPNALITENL